MNIVFPYFNNGGMLKRHIEEWKKYSDPLEWSVIIVDDCSIRDPISNYLDEIKTIPFKSVRIFQIETDIPWNQDGARNLAFKHINNEWCVSTDIDHLLSYKQATALLSFHKRTTNDLNDFYRFRRAQSTAPDQLIFKFHPNSYLIHSSLYWKIGGYEEKLAGYYGKDSNFRRRLENSGTYKGFLPDEIYLTLFGREHIPDASTVDYKRKGSKYHVGVHPEIRAICRSTEMPTSWLNFKWKELC
jgi:predicted glycosyltransferase involved in capsule biosynthesis